MSRRKNTTNAANAGAERSVFAASGRLVDVLARSRARARAAAYLRDPPR